MEQLQIVEVLERIASSLVLMKYLACLWFGVYMAFGTFKG